MIIVLRQLLANPLHPGIAAVWQLKPRRIKSYQHTEGTVDVPPRHLC